MWNGEEHATWRWKWLKIIAQVRKEKYLFVNFAFKWIFKVQAPMRTGNKNKFWFAWEQTNYEIQILLDATC